MEEKELYPLENGVVITNKVCTVNEEMHIIKTMSIVKTYCYSAQAQRQRGKEAKNELLIKAGFGLAITLGMVALAPELATYSFVLIAIGAIFYIYKKPAYAPLDEFSVKVAFSESKKDIYKSTDESEVNKIVKVLNLAIADL